LTGTPIFGDYDPNHSFNGRYIAYSSSSPDGQAARSWGAAFSYDAGTWDIGEHSYYLENVYTWPESGGETADPVQFNVSEDAPGYEGNVLLRYFALRARSGDACPPIDPNIRPDQATLFHYIGLTGELTYQDALAQFDSMVVTAYWDDGMSAGLARHEIFPWSSVDFEAYLCAAATP
jgi:hypothetical protein